jgi:hypothetical protein
MIKVMNFSNEIFMYSSLSEYDNNRYFASTIAYNSVYSKFFTISRADQFWIDFYDKGGNPIDIRKIMNNIYFEFELIL